MTTKINTVAFRRQNAPTTPCPAPAQIPGLIGLIHCGAGIPIDVVTGKTLSYTNAAAYTSRGVARSASATVGQFTSPLRRGMPGWEVSIPFTFFAYIQIDAYAGSSQADVGYTTPGYYLGEAFGTGQRSYSIGAKSIQSAGGALWPIGVPCFVAVASDASGNIEGYFNGVSDGTNTGAATPAYGTFSEIIMGHNSDGGGFAGKMHYMGLVNRRMSAAEIAFYAKHPFAVYAPRFVKQAAVSSATIFQRRTLGQRVGSRQGA